MPIAPNLASRPKLHIEKLFSILCSKVQILGSHSGLENIPFFFDIMIVILQGTKT